MRCVDALKIILVDSSGDYYAKEDITEAKKHILSCRKCRSYVDNNRYIKEIISETLPRKNAPESLKSNILESIGKNSEDKDTKRYLTENWKLNIVLMISIILVFLSIYYVIPGLRNNPGDFIVDRITAEHVEYLKGRNLVQISSSNPQIIENWFKNKTSFLLKVPVLQGVKLVGARLCNLFDRKIGVIVYENNNMYVSLFIFNYPELDISSLNMLDIDGKKLCRGHGNGVHVVLWKNTGLIYALVSRTKEMELLRLASNVQ